MLAPSIIDALPGMAALIASATRLALVASNWWRLKVSQSPVAKPVSTARSTVAPLAMRPLDGTLTVTFDPSAASTPSPPMTRLPWTIA